MKIGEKPVQKVNDQNEIITSIKQGIRFVFKTKIILYSISLDLFSAMFGGVMAILPIYAEDILHVGAQGLGILRAAPSLGAVITLLLLTRFSPMHHAWKILLLFSGGLLLIRFGKEEEIDRLKKEATLDSIRQDKRLQL